MSPSTDRLSIVFAALLGFMIFLLLLARFLFTAKEFKRTMRYIEREINRTQGRELKYWKRQKRLLWLSLLPFIRHNKD